jgi:hypothetical protein
MENRTQVRAPFKLGHYRPFWSDGRQSGGCGKVLVNAPTEQVPERCLVGFLLVKFRYEWFLFDYKKGYPDRISKPFKTRAAAEKGRGKYSPKVRGGIGVGIKQISITEAKRKPKRRS